MIHVLDPHLNTHHSNVGVRIRKEIEYVIHVYLMMNELIILHMMTLLVL